MTLWESFSNNAYYTPMLNFTLVDTEYWAIAPPSERERLLPTVFPGMLYHITNFKIIASQGPFRPLSTPKILVFGSDTKWEDYVFPSSIPRFKFNLTSWPRILTRIAKDTLLSDVAGVIICVEDIKLSQNGIQRLNLTLIDESLIHIHVSLWDVKARSFQRDFKEHRWKNVLTVMTGLLVKNSKGTVYLSSTPGTSIFFNPSAEPICNLPKSISCAYGDFICRQPQEIERRPSIVLHVKDHTGEIRINLQPPELSLLTGYSRRELLRDRTLVNGIWTFSTASGIIKGANCTFELMMAPSSYSNTTGKLIVDGIVQYSKKKRTYPA
ncbi:hypothetical protein ACET3Z_025851 [Daucus carota]